MGIVRTERPDGDWFMAHKGWAQDDRLTWEARGLLAYLFTKPDDWEVRVSDLVSSGPCQKYKIRRMLKELVEHGYADREKKRADDGTFQWVTTIHERPSPTQSGMDSVHHGQDRGYTKDTSSTKEGKKGSSGSARDARGMPDELLPLYDTYQPEVEEALQEYTPDTPERLVSRKWRQLNVSSTILRLAQEYPWPYFVTGVVVAANEADNPNARYLDTFLHAVTELDGQTPKNPTEDEQQSALEQLWNAARDA